jgi:hypothetical protein
VRGRVYQCSRQQAMYVLLDWQGAWISWFTEGAVWVRSRVGDGRQASVLALHQGEGARVPRLRQGPPEQLRVLPLVPHTGPSLWLWTPLSWCNVRMQTMYVGQAAPWGERSKETAIRQSPESAQAPSVGGWSRIGGNLPLGGRIRAVRLLWWARVDGGPRRPARSGRVGTRKQPGPLLYQLQQQQV